MKISNNYIDSNICIDADFEIGDIVKNSIFGIGKILATTCIRGEQRVTIFFLDGGKRNLIVTYANLKKLWTDKWMYQDADAGGRGAPRGTIIRYVDVIDINVDDFKDRG